MGYTHYWQFKTPKRGQKRIAAKQYADAIYELQCLCKSYSSTVGGLSGFGAHATPGQYSGLKINGAREDMHEDFYLRESLSLALQDTYFCKTAQKPYDVVVVACLIILSARLPDLFKVSSDGDTSDWNAGLLLARRFTRENLKMPKNIRIGHLRVA
jgi:hypothetical protein